MSFQESTEESLQKYRKRNCDQQEAEVNNQLKIKPELLEASSMLAMSSSSMYNRERYASGGSSSTGSSSKANRISQSSQQVQIERHTAKRVGSRLKNLLKLPKAHKMCVYEWFYSNVDNALFNKNNDFCMCLKESFPELKTHKLTRAHWSKIRRMMGKPRRCSEAFFQEERLALANKRNKIRQLQQNKIPKEDHDTWSLPREVPLPLVVGTYVTAWLRGHNDGLFTGQIDAIDAAHATYRVTFDRPNLSTHVVPDVEVCSFEPQETVNIMSLIDQHACQQQQGQPHFTFPVGHLPESASGASSSATEHDPILGGSPMRSKLQLSSIDEAGGTLGGFPIQLLKKVARLSRTLTLKKDKIQKLSEMNSQAEKSYSYGESLSLEFQRQYATIVIELERLNKELNDLLVGVHNFCLDLYPEQILPADNTSHIRKRCNNLAKQMISSKNVEKKTAISPHLSGLITDLTSLLFQVKTLTELQGTSIEFKSLTDSLKEIRSKISPSNRASFQKNVEIHIAHIKDGMEHEKYLSSLNSSNTTNTST